MKAETVYTKLNSPDENYVGPNSSRIELLAQNDMSRFGVFALCFSSMVHYPVRSYGKIKRSYVIEVWELTDDGLQCVKEYCFATKAECLKRFKQGQLV